MTTNTTTHYLIKDDAKYDILQLIRHVSTRPSFEIKINELLRVSRSAKSGFSQKRYDAVNVNDPILVYIHDGSVIDGRHRVAKMLDQNYVVCRAIFVSAEDLALCEIEMSDYDQYYAAFNSTFTDYLNDLENCDVEFTKEFPDGRFLEPSGFVFCKMSVGDHGLSAKTFVLLTKMMEEGYIILAGEHRGRIYYNVTNEAIEPMGNIPSYISY